MGAYFLVSALPIRTLKENTTILLTGFFLIMEKYIALDKFLKVKSCKFFLNINSIV